MSQFRNQNDRYFLSWKTINITSSVKTKLKIAAQKHDEDNRNHNGFFMSVVSSFVDKSFAGNSLYLRGLGLYML